MKIENFSTNTKTIMNKSLNLNTMKNNYFKNTLKLGITAIFIMALGTANAQTAGAGSDNTLQAAAAGETIKLIDNKGTIKYLQSNNGITTITSTADNNKTTTTWQLGGTLVEATKITTSGNEFTIDGEEFNLTGTGVNASAAATVTDGATGYTLLVREEGSGRIKKMLASELVTSGREDYTAKSEDESATTTIGAVGMPLVISKVSVYRNGAKLRAGTDYTVALNADSKPEVTLVPKTAAVNEDSSGDWNIYTGDQFEVQWIK